MKLYVQLHWNGSADQYWNPQNKQQTNANYFTELFRAPIFEAYIKNLNCRSYNATASSFISLRGGAVTRNIDT